jgi:hypothetical protein
MSATTIPTMIVEDVELCVLPSATPCRNPIDCNHLWEPHFLETNRAHCRRCRSCARWVNRRESPP